MGTCICVTLVLFITSYYLFATTNRTNIIISVVFIFIAKCYSYPLVENPGEGGHVLHA